MREVRKGIPGEKKGERAKKKGLYGRNIFEDEEIFKGEGSINSD